MEKRQLLGEYTKDYILKILKTCSNNKKSGADVAETIRSGIIYNNRFDQNSSNDVLDILQKCAVE